MSDLKTTYSKVKVFGTPHFSPRFANRTLGSEIYFPVSETERTRRELLVVPLEDTDFLFQSNILERDGQEKEIQRIPLGFGCNMSVNNYLLWVSVKGGCVPAEPNAPEIERANQIVDKYKLPPKPKRFFSAVRMAGDIARMLFP